MNMYKIRGSYHSDSTFMISDCNGEQNLAESSHGWPAFGNPLLRLREHCVSYTDVARGIYTELFSRRGE